MKYTLFFLLLASLLPLGAASGDDSHADPLAGAFFPPELIVQAHDQIGMSQEQLEAFRAQVQKAQPRSDELRQRLESETAALAALAKQERVDEPALMAQLDKVLDAERDLKHLHMGLLATIKNLLTPDQQTKLREITKDGGSKLAEAVRKRLTEKVEKVKDGVQKWQAGGRDPSAIAQAMEEKFKPLIEAGKVIEAEAELDRLLEQLKEGGK
jgi:Spy/CpxP family protein refolding chaperone